MFVTLLFSVYIYGCTMYNILGTSFTVFPGTSFELTFVVDSVAVVFSTMIYYCVFLALPFSLFYFIGQKPGRYFVFKCLVLFRLIMCGLVASYAYFGTLIFWEYLGLSRFSLILYFRGGSAVRPAIITILCSRLGDVALILCVAYLYKGTCDLNQIGFLLLFSVVTKSATYPFMRWLIRAMVAPTPVSCLVHSSTLVAAGVFLALRYRYQFRAEVCNSIALLRLVTIVLTGAVALYVDDLKQVVAFSTCKSISWCLLCFSLGCTELSIELLVTHGLLKCIIFCMVGKTFKISYGSQRMLNLRCNSFVGYFYSCGLSWLLFSLSGVQLVGIFLTKHVLIEACFKKGKIFLIVLMVVGIVLSYGYRFRL